jgi:uncharacterized RDD family membrane protein YckC
MAIDLAVLLVAAILIIATCYLIMPANEAWEDYALYSCLGFTYFYLVILESSRFGTLGFIITGVKVLNLKGERPSLLRMTLRQLLWVVGPFHPFTDLLWLGGDDFRQTLRDKFAGTIVVKRDAVPAGRGPVHLRYYGFAGLMLAFAEVQKPRSSTTNE